MDKAIGAIPEIFKALSDGDKLPIIVICGLFLIIGRYISASTKKSEEIQLSIEEKGNEIIQEMKDMKLCVVRLMYDLHLKEDRRKARKPVEEDRRG